MSMTTLSTILSFLQLIILCSSESSRFTPIKGQTAFTLLRVSNCLRDDKEHKTVVHSAREETVHGNTYSLHRNSDLVGNNNRRSLLALLSISANFAPTAANAIPFFETNHRQLELCLVTILRTKFWAMNTAKSLQTKLLTTTVSESLLEENVRKLPYLEARLGAKALLTQKIGGGGTSTVLKLASFNIKECLDDGKYWCAQLSKSNQLDKRICTNDLVSISEDIVESLASVVEFDGLETTIDPSPRSSLMLSMYNPQKGNFVYRTLTERVIPSCERYLDVFGEDRQRLCLEFVKRDYSDEIPFEVLMDLYDDDDDDKF